MINHLCRRASDCWKDRRNYRQMFSRVWVFVALLIWTFAIAVAQHVTADPQKTVSLSEHADEIISYQMFVILALAGGYVTVISWVFLTNIRDLKHSIREGQQLLLDGQKSLKKDISKKVSIQVHNAICKQGKITYEEHMED